VSWTVGSGRKEIMSMSKENTPRVPAVPAALLGDEPALAKIARQFGERARGEGIALTGQGGLLPALIADILQAESNIELDEYLGYDPPARPTAGGRATRVTARTRGR
jgi:hypothetical protein